jgi:hypothetical protein
MKRFLPVLVAVLFWSGAAQAQDFSFRYGLQLLTIPSVQIGSELSFGDWGFGSRATFGSALILFSRVQFDGYVFMQISEFWQGYTGIGIASFNSLFEGSLNDIHLLLGFRLPVGFYVEFVPRLFIGTGCSQFEPCTGASLQPRAIGYGFDFGLGFSWRF